MVLGVLAVRRVPEVLAVRKDQWARLVPEDLLVLTGHPLDPMDLLVQMAPLGPQALLDQMDQLAPFHHFQYHPTPQDPQVPADRPVLELPVHLQDLAVPPVPRDPKGLAVPLDLLGQLVPANLVGRSTQYHPWVPAARLAPLVRLDPVRPQFLPDLADLRCPVDLSHRSDLAVRSDQLCQERPAAPETPGVREGLGILHLRTCR